MPKTITPEVRDLWIETESNALWEKLRFFSPNDRIFVLSEVARRCQVRLKNRESTRYSVDFTRDEPPTEPQPRIASSPADRETRAINVDELRGLIKKSEE